MSNMVINNNMMAVNSHRSLKLTGGVQSKAMEKLSSGLRINRAADDAAGLAISEKMRGQIRGLNQASRNAQDGISLIQTAEGALTETHAMLQRMRELTVQASNDTYTDEDRANIVAELNQLSEEITAITEKTEFNKKTLLNGSLSGTGNEVFLQVGANSGQSIKFGIAKMTASVLSVDKANVGNIISAAAAAGGGGGSVISGVITTINTAITTVSTERAKLGAIQNRLEHTINNVDISAENLQSAESRIRDTDMAQEMVTFTKSNILQQAATAMLAQANQAPQGVLQLLG